MNGLSESQSHPGLSNAIECKKVTLDDACLHNSKSPPMIYHVNHPCRGAEGRSSSS